MRVTKYTLLASFLLLGVVIEALSSIEWALYPYFPDRGLLFARIDASTFSILAPFSPTFLILLLYIWPIRLAMSLDNKVSKRLRSYVDRVTGSLLQLGRQTAPNSRHGLALTHHPRVLLLLAVAAALFFGLILYRPDLNPSMTPIGVDAHFYIDSVNQMLQLSPSAAISYAMGNALEGSRPLVLLPMYLATVTGLVSVNLAYEALPAILGPLVAIATFIFVREGLQNERAAGAASLFSTLSFGTTVGMWAGFYANWLALAETYFFLAALLGFLKARSAPRFIAMTLLSVSLLFTHPWTWVIILTVTTTFILTLWRDDRKHAPMRALGALLATDIILDFAKSLVFGSSVAVQDASTGLSGSGISQALLLWPNIIYGLFTAYGGLLGNAILLGLPVITVTILRFREKFERLLLLWVALSSIPFLATPSLVETRILYDMPFPVLISLALLFPSRPIVDKSVHSNLAFLFLLLLLLNYVLRAVTSLVAPPF